MNLTETQLLNIIASLVGAILIYMVTFIHGLRSEVRSEFAENRAMIIQLAQDVAFIRGQLTPRPEQISKAEG
jgi:hypothetical protein